MQLIGYWIESLLDEKFLPPQELVGDLSTDTRARIVSYLDSGTLFAQYRGLSWCRFGCSRDSREMGSAELTDGEWVWPAGLSHYVGDHDVSLPAEFVSHVLAGGSKAPDPVSQESPDDRLWVKWCRANSTGRLRPALARALQSADARAEALRQASWKELEARTGLSNVGCLHHGCSNRALKDMALCAKHSMRPEAYDPGSMAYYTGLVEVLHQENT